MRTEQTPWSVLLMALAGVTGFAFAVSVGWWWVAHHMALWTFAATYTGWALLVAVGKVTARGLRK